MEIHKELAKQTIDNQIIILPEFEKYEIYKGKTTVKPKEGNLTQAFRYVGNGLGSLSSYFTGKYEEYDVGNKLKTGGTATWNGLSTAGSYLLNFTKYASGKAVQGVNYLYKQVSGNKDNDNTKEKGNIIIEREGNEDNEENSNNIILLNNEDERDNDKLIFKKPDKDEDEDIEDKERDNNNKNIILDNKNDEDDNVMECNIIEENEESVNNSAAPIQQIKFQK